MMKFTQFRCFYRLSQSMHMQILNEIIQYVYKHSKSSFSDRVVNLKFNLILSDCFQSIRI